MARPVSLIGAGCLTHFDQRTALIADTAPSTNPLKSGFIIAGQQAERADMAGVKGWAEAFSPHPIDSPKIRPAKAQAAQL